MALVVKNGRTGRCPSRTRMAAITRESHNERQKGSDEVHSAVRAVYPSNRNRRPKHVTPMSEILEPRTKRHGIDDVIVFL